MDAKFNIQGRLQAKYRDVEFKPSVHAELRLLANDYSTSTIISSLAIASLHTIVAIAILATTQEALYVLPRIELDTSIGNHWILLIS
jgi:hypothetical protein